MLNRAVCLEAPADEFSAWPGGRVTAWLAWTAPALYFLFEFLVRVLPSVIEPQLQSEVHATGAQFGFNMGLYYLAYAPMQLVVGVLLDRFGGRGPLTTSSIALAGGCVLFALATSIGWMGAGRFLMGFGSAFAYVGAIYVATSWFPRKRLALIAGLTAALGMLGAVAGQIVVGLLLETTPWRTAMWACAGTALALAVCMWMLIPDRPAYITRRICDCREAAGGTLRGALGSVLGRGVNWLLALITGLMFLPIGVFASLWGDRFLESGLGMAHQSATQADSMIYVGLGVSAPLMGWWTDRTGRRMGTMRIGTALMLISMLLQFYVVTPETAGWSWVLLFLMGFGGGSLILGFPLAIERNPAHARGLSMAFLNCGQMGLVFFGQWVTGLLFDLVAGSGDDVVYTLSDARKAFLMLPVAVALALGLQFLIPTGHQGSDSVAKGVIAH
ncbi:MAG: MFS transporter [Phycisphaerales bacterium]|nr:MFS transporter [Phycisphaerales bacterium]